MTEPLTIDGKLQIKFLLGKASYWVKGNNVLQSCNSKTRTSPPSFSSPLNYEASIIESSQDTVTDTYWYLEE